MSVFVGAFKPLARNVKHFFIVGDFSQTEHRFRFTQPRRTTIPAFGSAQILRRAAADEMKLTH